jgi:hypothetical protein
MVGDDKYAMTAKLQFTEPASASDTAAFVLAGGFAEAIASTSSVDSCSAG